MNFKYVISLIALSLCLVSVGVLSNTMTQKSTIITINGDDVGKPLVCNADFACELRNANIGFILRHESVRVTVFNGEDVQRACEAGWRAGVNAIVLTMGADHTCSR